MIEEKLILIAVSFNMIVLLWLAFVVYQVKKHIRKNETRINY